MPRPCSTNFVHYHLIAAENLSLGKFSGVRELYRAITSEILCMQLMKLGFASAILPDLDFHQVFSFAKEVGYACVEVMCWPPSKADRRYAGITHIDLTTLDDQTIASVQKTVAETGVQISALGYYPNVLSPDLAKLKNVPST